MRITAPLTALALTIAAMAVSPAIADDDVRCTGTGGQWMSSDSARAKAVAMGYDVRRIKTEGSCYEISAIDRNGARVEFYLNPVSGEVVTTSRDRS